MNGGNIKSTQGKHHSNNCFWQNPLTYVKISGQGLRRNRIFVIISKLYPPRFFWQLQKRKCGILDQILEQKRTLAEKLIKIPIRSVFS